jgi:hypothetical protein
MVGDQAEHRSLVSSWILRSADARSSVGEAVMTTRASHTTLSVRPGRLLAPASQLGRTRMLCDMVARWNVPQAHNARPGDSHRQYERCEWSSAFAPAVDGRCAAVTSA